jgi:hypothetical protein
MQRLVPINKVYPKKPTINDYRPIMVMSHRLKFLEICLQDKLKGYVDDKNNLPCQFGFREGHSTFMAQ